MLAFLVSGLEHPTINNLFFIINTLDFFISYKTFKQKTPALIGACIVYYPITPNHY